MSNAVVTKRLKISLLAYKEEIAETVFDHINAFVNFSKNNVMVHDLSSPSNLDVKKIIGSDVIVIHYTASLLSMQRLPLFLRLLIKKYKNPKAIFIQDENRFVNQIHDALNALEIDLLFTCIPENEIENVYPSAKLPFLKSKINVLTGYVPEKLIKYFHTRPSYNQRKCDVAYRSRRVPIWYGQLGLQKTQISDKFQQHAKEYNLKVNLSYSESSRIYGQEWIDFIQHSKASLGVESGSGVFDFTGEIQAKVEEYQRSHPLIKYDVLEKLFFPGLDGKIYFNQISPRCFECAALGTLMILYEGNYSGVLKPWQHYIPLKIDHSNIEEVINALKDESIWNKVTTQAFNDIALNEKYSYKVMIDTFDKSIDELKHQISDQSHIFNFSQQTKKRHSLLKMCIIILKKSRVLTLVSRLCGKLARAVNSAQRYKESFRQLLNIAVDNNLNIGLKDAIRLLKVESLLLKYGFNSSSWVHEVTVLECLYLRYMSTSPFLIEIIDGNMHISYLETSTNTETITGRILKLRDKIGEINKVVINFPDSSLLSKNLANLNQTTTWVGIT